MLLDEFKKAITGNIENKWTSSARLVSNINLLTSCVLLDVSKAALLTIFELIR